MTLSKAAILFGLSLIVVNLLACGRTEPVTTNQPGGIAITPEEARQIAREAFVYGFPLVTNYDTMYKQAVDATNRDYRAPFNVIGRTTGVATPDDKFVVTPNSDTPYSFLWMDLRVEPIVITMPKIEKGRYYTAQLIDLYTYNFDYLGTRAYGNDGGKFVVAGPTWIGDPPNGTTNVLHSETWFAYALFRTQLFNAADLGNVTKTQAGFDARPLSVYLGEAAPPAAPPVDWPKPEKDMTTTSALFRYLNFLLQFCPTNPSETGLMTRFAKLNIGAGKEFDAASLSPEIRTAVDEGIADAWKDLEGLQKKINAEEVSSSNLFGTRDYLKDNYLYRFGGAKLGLYGNSGDEAIYLAYFVDGRNQPADASKTNYVLRFPKGKLPPARAFWSLTMYDGKTQFLVANPLNRYLLNSTMLKAFKYDPDGSLTLYVQKDSPGPAKESNWLPAPDGPFYAILRVYMPAPEVVNGTWKKPPMEPAT